MNEIIIPAEKVKIIETVDVCVVGGSCTGVFAAIRAARLGAKVAIIERQNRFGGVATCGLVGMWHSLFDTAGEREIIGGLTRETLERLDKRNAVSEFRTPAYGIRFNTEELTLELDEMVCEHPNISIYLQTNYSRPLMADGQLDAIVIENKSGRFAIKAGAFVDASGDGLLCRDAGLSMRLPELQQPPTSCVRFENWLNMGRVNLCNLLEQYRAKYPNLPPSYFWNMPIPGSGLIMHAGTRVLNCDCSDAAAITRAEITSRRQIRALMDMLREAFPDNKLSLQALPSAIGLRESYHINAQHQLTGAELLSAARPTDAIANGTYPVDIHNSQDDSIAFKRLDGTYSVSKQGQQIVSERWLPEGQIVPFYQIPLSSLIPLNSRNIVSAGRMIDADREAFGAVRVMVNLNQCGEAAGVAAWQIANGNPPTPAETRKLLAAGGSIII